MNERDRKRQLKADFKAQQLATLEASLPISKTALKGLFDRLDQMAHTCDHTLAETTSYLTGCDIDPAIVVPWLQEHGGYCDCEVLSNVEDAVADLSQDETDV